MCVYNLIVLCLSWAPAFELYVFLTTRQLYFGCIVKYYILIFWQNKVMMLMYTNVLRVFMHVLFAVEEVVHCKNTNFKCQHMLQYKSAKRKSTKWREQRRSIVTERFSRSLKVKCLVYCNAGGNGCRSETRGFSMGFVLRVGSGDSTVAPTQNGVWG